MMDVIECTWAKTGPKPIFILYGSGSQTFLHIGSTWGASNALMPWSHLLRVCFNWSGVWSGLWDFFKSSLGDCHVQVSLEPLHYWVFYYKKSLLKCTIITAIGVNYKENKNLPGISFPSVKFPLLCLDQLSMVPPLLLPDLNDHARAYIRSPVSQISVCFQQRGLGF